ncbi:MAG: outer membrane beta-barrel protein [Pseudomonadota bacterium]
MKLSILKFTVAAAALLNASTVFATDYNSGVVTKTPSAVQTPVEFGSGWYLRGDISFNLEARQETSSQFINSLGATTEAEYEDVIGYRVGFGYILNPSIRLEVAAEQTFDSEFDGSIGVNLTGLELQTVGGVTGQVPVNNIFGVEVIEADYDATNIMFNGYYDLPKIGHFTPYVGAGVGLSRIEFNERRTLTCIPDSTQTCGPPAAGAQGARVDDVVILDTEEVTYQFAYQLSVGTAYELSENLDLDVGYSYFSTNDGAEISYSDGTAIETDAFSVHKINVGLRYELF